MRIQLKRFGNILASRPAGREAALVMKAYHKPAADEKVELDFEGVVSMGPSWLDEVLSELRREFGKDRVICLPTKNPSVIESLKVIDSGDSGAP
jgi:hypothetical protein